jgi:hypothetical protein
MPKATTTPANGITAEVIRDCMKPYGFGPDLLEDFVASLPPPPPEASAAWRHRHLTRLVQEVAIFMPADDAQARLAADVVGMRELAGVMRRKAVAPGVTTAEQCRLSRTAADVFRAALAGERQLDRRQHLPAPFFGTLLSDPVSIGALDAVWTKGAGGMIEVAETGAMERMPPGACPGGATGVADQTAAPVPGAMEGDPRVEPEDGHAAVTAPPIAVGSARGDTDSMDRETEGAGGAGAGLATAPRREGVVVEQGEGWSLEVWPATASCAAAGDGAAGDGAAGDGAAGAAAAGGAA